MTTEEITALEIAKGKLIDNYRGQIKGTPHMIAGSMSVAYRQGVENMLRLIIEGYELTGKLPVQPKEAV